MTQSVRTISGAELRGTATGVLFMAFFGTLWAYTGIMGLQGWGNPWLLVAAIAIGVIMMIGGSSLIFASRRFKYQVSNASRGKNIGKRFNIIFIAEGLAIGIAIGVCNAIDRSELIPIVIAIIVGIHFFPLASLFQVKFYYVTGGLLCLIAVITWLFVPETITLNGNEIKSFMAVVGVGSALILWGTSIAIWLIGKRLVMLAQGDTSPKLNL